MNRIIIFFSFLLFSLQCQAQLSGWLAGYRFRKAVTFNKSMVSGNDRTLSNFIVLVQLEEADLAYDIKTFDQHIAHPDAYDIAFTTTASPTIPLKFELERYEPLTGKLLCWLQVPEIYTSTEPTFQTTVYLYYGSDKLYNPSTTQVWNGIYEQVDHLNYGADGKVSTGRNFNGTSDYLFKPATSKVNLTISAWIKPLEIGREQVIFSNDTTGSGYLLKIDSFGKLVFEALTSTGRSAFAGSKVLTAGEWYLINLKVVPSGNIHNITLLINGVIEFSRASGKVLTISTGSMVIARSKQADRHFHGNIDEWRLGNVFTYRESETEYRNQNNPKAFSTAGAEEQNPSEIFFYTFTGVQSNVWNININWSPRLIPPANKSIRIQQGKSVILPANTIINQLLLEKNANVQLSSTASVINRTILESGSTLSGAENSRLQLQGDLHNDGQLILDKVNSKLQIYGGRNRLAIGGIGSARVSALEIDLPAVNATLELQSTMELSSSLQILNGLLNSNGHLHLLSVAGQTAMVYPLGRESSISGDVHVQSQVDGSFPDPASGRGWRLLSSPVFQTPLATSSSYNFTGLQKSIFVSGAGGISRGFDPSPNNGATIYTHNQALAGTLSQKYVPIANMNAQVALGYGFFVFSRGSRFEPDAYQQQMVTRPFANPASYLITYTGKLFKGALTVQVFNKDGGGEGDGFNLLGNPYASPIRWGSLNRVNVGPNVWLFEPLNNSYLVSNDPDTVIPAGAGFFVLVNPGFQSGTVSFDENAKVLPK